ncbi:MAG: AMP-binding protein [Alphaproteobacteria bacterium]|nr:AMP-binding protein [Alphaproteobacteria bacterium]
MAIKPGHHEYDYSSWEDEKIYEKAYKASLKNPSEFWNKYVDDISWKRKPQTSYSNKWLDGGVSNVCYNCVDRHALSTPDKPAIIWHGDEYGERREISYEALRKMVQKIAAILKSYGVKKGDVVGIYLPMIPEAIASMLACARIGAIHLVVFAGFSSEALKYRLTKSNAKAIITVNSFKRGGKRIDLQQNIICNINIINLDDVTISDNMNTDIEWQNSDDDLFVLYTSGSSGKPKGVLHSALPYMLYVATTFKIIFGIRIDDVYFCTSDIGWITGHSYITYAPLFHGLTTVIFSGSPTYPNADRYWQIIEQEKVSIFYTAPTAIRSLQMFNKKFVKKHDLSSLRVLGSVGEPINKSAWKWYFETVGNKRCPIMDTWWQTETGGIILAPLRNLNQNPGLAGKPFFGVEIDIIDGELVIKNKFPGLCKSIISDNSYTSNAFYNTGDGAVYEGSDIKIKGRMDDVINISGHRLGTAEFECAINKIDEVKEVAVVAVPDELKGQTAFAYIVPIVSNIDPEILVKKIINSTRATIGSIAKPDYIAIVPDLPKTRSGKIVRKLLRDIANGIETPSELHSVVNPEVIEDVKSSVNNPIFCPDMCKLP